MAYTRAAGIYQIVNLVTGDRYVGSAVSIAKRWRAHRDALRRASHENSHLQRAWDKYGETGFAFVVLESVLDTAQLIAREQHWMDTLHPEYNIVPIAGSRLGSRHTVEGRANISNGKRGRKQSPEHIAARVAKLIGKRHTPETKAKVAAANLGRKDSPERRANISKGRKGVPVGERTPEYRRKLSDALRGRRPSDATIAASVATRRGVPLSDEHKQKVSESLKGKKRPPRTPEQIERYRQAALRRMADPARRQHLSEVMKARGIAPRH